METPSLPASGTVPIPAADSSLPKPLTLSIESAFPTDPRFRSAWDEAAERLKGPVYMTFDWLKTWWDHYGKGKKLRLFVASQGSTIVGLVPLYIDSFGVGPLAARVVRLVGANLPPKTFDPPVDPAAARGIFSHILRSLFGSDRVHLLSLGPISDEWSGRDGFVAAATAENQFVRPPEYEARDVQTLFRLPETFEEYLATLSSTERKNRMKRVRRLEKEHPITLDIVSEREAVRHEFERFVEQHSIQWGVHGKGGHFAAWPGAEVYNRALVETQAVHGRVRFFRMLAGDQVIANRFTFLFGGTLFSELPSRAVGEPWDGLGIGAISLLKFTEQVIGCGIRTVDSGLGAYDHKASLGGHSVQTGIWRCTGRSLPARVLAGLFQVASSILRTTLHKVWYRRILPKLPASFGRSQSMLWLRFDA